MSRGDGGTLDSVRVHRIDATHAHVSSPLAAGEAVVALGTHRLSPGLAVRELPR